MRILHTPVNIANQAWIISRAQRKLGHKSDLLMTKDIYGYRYGYKFDFLWDADEEPNRFRRYIKNIRRWL